MMANRTSRETDTLAATALLGRAAELGIIVPPERLPSILTGARQLADSAERVRAFLMAIDAQARKP